MIKNDDGEEDDGIPVDTVAVVLLDRGTGWIALYPKASKSTEHTVEAFQHFAGAKENRGFVLRQRARLEGRSAPVRLADLNRDHRSATNQRCG